MTVRSVLVFFGRDPSPGRVKTRLVPPLTMLQAATLYRAFLADILRDRQGQSCEAVLSLAPPFSERSVRSWLPQGVELVGQSGADLSERIAAAFDVQFRRSSVRHVVVRNTDSPLLSREREEQAFLRLEEGFEIVLGPDRGGGYYLVGLSRPLTRLFRGIPMSVPSNFELTLERAHQLSQRVAVLPREPDTDCAADLFELAARLRADPAARELAPETARVIDQLFEDGAFVHRGTEPST